MPMVWVYHSNFKNTFIKTTVNYQIDLDDYYSKSINIERLFYSALNGLEFIDNKFRKDSDNNVYFHTKTNTILMIYGLVMPLKF
jgi:hypothetical protein